MKYTPYPKEYKTRMLRFLGERIASCRANINLFQSMLENPQYDREQKNNFLIMICKERNLLKFLEANSYEKNI